MNMSKDNNELKITSKEEAIFKAYLEENTMKSGNIFEFIESNLSYYSNRYTSDEYFSPYEFAHVNSFYHFSNEFSENKKLLGKAERWYIETVHPKDSEYIFEGNKYISYNAIPKKLKSLCNKLESEGILNFYSTDLLLVYEDKIYQYLPEKKFLFKWKDNIDERRKIFIEQKGFLFNQENIELKKESIIIIPIFIPVREMLFLGEIGYRESMLKHGAILHYLEYNLSDFKLDYFSVEEFNKWLQIDGVERSVLSYFIKK
ncbi:hypothetical protein [Enterococcus faecalis]|uniref:hypothetical protein n=1 Tax=Enterococcus faecalis TaxID=1351 RepID=UPI002FBEADF1